MRTDWQPIVDDFKAVLPAVDFWSPRLVHDETETRRPQPQLAPSKLRMKLCHDLI